MAERKKDWTGNVRSIWSTNGCSNHSNTEREVSDFYATDPVSIDKLVKKFPIPHYVWECACGQGHLSKRLEQRGHSVYSSELEHRGYGVQGVNFLTEDKLPIELPINDVCILTNPPYRYTTEFVLHALDILPENGYAIFLLKTTALEGKGRFELIYKNTPPIFVFQFVERLQCAKSGDFDNIGGSAQAYAWFVWKKGYKGPTTIDWI